MSIEAIRDALKDRRIGLVASATGLHSNTIRAVRDGTNVNPTYNVMKALSNYFEGNG
jgi:hypothetical protein